MDELVIDPRFNGPVGSANGGYTCGLVADFVDGTAEVTLRRPPPLGRPLAVERDGGRVVVRDGEAVIAEAVQAQVDLPVPGPPTYDEATQASSGYPGFDEHAFPTCFVCGPDREVGDGLRIFAGPLGDGLVASPWMPTEVDRHSSSGLRSTVRVRSPSGFPDRGETLLGRFAARIDELPEVGERCVVVGWPLGEDGRKLYAGTALYGEDGRLACARSSDLDRSAVTRSDRKRDRMLRSYPWLAGTDGRKPTRFKTADLSGNRFEVEPDQPVWFEQITVRGVDFGGLRFGTKDADGGLQAHSCLFEDCDFSDVTFAVADLGWGGRTVYRRCTFDRADMHQVLATNSPRMMAFRLGEARFEDCTFLEANIRGWLAHEADFVGCRFRGTIDRCRFFGTAPDRRWFRIKRNEYHRNDFREVEFIWSRFEAGIPIDGQLWPSNPEYIRQPNHRARCLGGTRGSCLVR